MYRQINTLVLDAKFETINYYAIPKEMRKLDKEIEMLMDKSDMLPLSEYIKRDDYEVWYMVILTSVSTGCAFCFIVLRCYSRNTEEITKCKCHHTARVS